MSIIRRFSYVVLSFTRHSKSDFESVYRVNGKLSIFIIISIVSFIAPPISNPFTIP